MSDLGLFAARIVFWFVFAPILFGELCLRKGQVERVEVFAARVGGYFYSFLVHSKPVQNSIHAIK